MPATMFARCPATTVTGRSSARSVAAVSPRGMGLAKPMRMAVPASRSRAAAFVPQAAARRSATVQRTESGGYDDEAAIAASPLFGRAASPFFQPTARALVLGLGAGAAAEMLHVATKLAIGAAQTGGVTGVLARMYPSLAPLMVLDHVAAIAVMLGVYMAEGPAMMAALRSNVDDLKGAARAASKADTAPKAFLSKLTLPSLRKALYNVLRGSSVTSPAAASASASDGASGASRAASGGLDRAGSSPAEQAAPLRSQSGDMGMSRTSSSGSAVLDRPPAREPETKQPTKKPAVDRPSANNVVPAPKLRRTPSGGSPAASPAPAPPTTNPRDASRQRREQELKDRNSYLKNFWYAAALSQNLKADKPMRVDILGRSVTLYRDEHGVARCLDNACPHRGAPLSQGWTKNVDTAAPGAQQGASKGGKCVVCPYHGWAFDKEGKLAEVPSSPAGTVLPKRSLVDAYPVEEEGGFIWLFFGSKGLPAAERPPLPIIPELKDPKWKAVYGEIEFDCGHHSVFENAIDMAHIHYLHEDSFGNKDKPVIHDMKVERDTFSVTAKFRIHNKPVNPLWNWTAVESVPVEATAFLPSTSSVKITLGAGVQMITYVNTVPISPTKSINRFCLIRNFAQPGLFDPFAERAMYRILGEDKVMIDKLIVDNVPQELSLEADLPQIAFRKLRQEWVQMGYGVDPSATQGHHGSLTLDQ